MYPGTLTFEGRRAFDFRGITLGCDTDPKVVLREKSPGRRDNANHVRKLRWGGRGWGGGESPLVNEHPSFRVGHDLCGA